MTEIGWNYFFCGIMVNVRKSLKRSLESGKEEIELTTFVTSVITNRNIHPEI